MMDNVVDRTVYPLEEQEQEAKNKRRMGLGITGLANTLTFLGIEYGSEESVEWLQLLMTILRNEAYKASVELAKEKGAFPLFRQEYLNSEFIQTLPMDIRESIRETGIRNSHLLSVAPTGTISLWAGNISSGIEPVFEHEYERTVIMPGNDLVRKTFDIQDYAWSEWGIKGEKSSEISAKEHIDILCTASVLVDSACSKTCNVGEDVNFHDFKELYMQAYDGGASGCTTFRPAGLRVGVLRSKDNPKPEDGSPVDTMATVEGATCEIDPVTGERSCAD